MDDAAPERITVEDIETRLRIACRDVIAYWSEMIPDGVESRTTGTIGRSEQVLEPVRLHALDVRRDTLECLTGWALVIAEERDLRPRLDTGDAVGLARFIDNHYDWLARHDAGLDAADEIHALSRKIHGVAFPRKLEPQIFVGPCECGARLHAPREEQMVTCPTCARATHRDDLRDAALDVVRDLRFTPAQAVRVAASLSIDLKRNTINVWVKRGRLWGGFCTIEDRAHWYRFRDIEELAKGCAEAS